MILIFDAQSTVQAYRCSAVDSNAHSVIFCSPVQVSLRAKVDLPPDDVYEILIAPDNSAVFKGIKVSHIIRQLQR